ncbi:DUF4365 domain-containing protein [Streptomyces parvus]|uniref:DUF4365 domain-containing protein n=1 Tax=Streptomyces parvus TaxID=66428 RepID=A0A5D4IE07_9ACTN|nr:DUF4365 domain-containing protein [Streptomyces parvus]
MNERPAKRGFYGVPLRSGDGGYPTSSGLGRPPGPGAIPPPTVPPGSAGLPATSSLEPLELGDNNHKGDFGEQFVRALATAANLNVSSSRDRLGIDWELTYPGRGGTRKFPQIQAQVKCWNRPEQAGEEWRYQLSVRNYNLLSGRDYYTPRFLFLVVVPRNADDWIEASHEGLLLRYAAYWTCFHEHDPVDRPDGDRLTVSVPKANLLTTQTLHDLFGGEFRAMLGVS